MVWAAVTFVRGMPVGSSGGVGGKGEEVRKVLKEREKGKGEREMECVWRVVHVSGTVRKCEEEAVRRAKGLLGRVRGLGWTLGG